MASKGSVQRGIPPLLLAMLILCALFHESEAIRVDSLTSSERHHQTHNINEPKGSPYWKELKSKLRGFAKEEIHDLLEALHQLEKEIEDKIEDNSILVKDRFETSDNFEEEHERHPGDELLQRHQADGTISYILGGY